MAPNQNENREMQIAFSDRKTQVLELLQYATSLVPTVGGLLSSVFGGLASGRKFQRIEEVVRGLLTELKGIHQQHEAYIRSEDFEDIFEQALSRSARERNESKRILIKDFLSNAVRTELSYDDYVRLRVMRILEEILPLDIIVLVAMLQAPNDQESAGLVSGSPMGTLKMRTAEHQLQEEQLKDIVSNLNRMGLTNLTSLTTMMTASGARDLRHSITKYGHEIIGLISS
jgi:hypothetical protein